MVGPINPGAGRMQAEIANDEEHSTECELNVFQRRWIDGLCQRVRPHIFGHRR